MPRDWRDQHLEEFVKPQLGRIPDKDDKVINPSSLKSIVSQWTPIRCKQLKLAWEVAKKKVAESGRYMLLAGRDVFTFEILARLEDYPTTFRPDISTSVSLYPSLVPEPYANTHHMIDTGFRGTVAKRLKMDYWHLVKCNEGNKKLYTNKEGKKYVTPTGTTPFLLQRQLLPYASRHFLNIASYMESFPKYWTSAITDEKHTKIIQQKTDEHSFVMASLVTQYLLDFYAPIKVRRYFISPIGRYL